MAQVYELRPREDAEDMQRAKSLYDAQKYDEAYALLDKALMEQPLNAEALHLMGAVLKKVNRVSLSYPLAKLAAQLRPDKAEAWIGVAHSEQLLWMLDEAEQNYRKALARAQGPGQKATCLNNLSSVFLDRGDFAGAEPLARKSLELEDDKQTHHNLALALLGQRQWEEGWKFYTGSMGTTNRLTVKYKNPPEPVWDGAAGKTVVISGEQGLGDEICAASMIPDAIRDCKKVVVDCDKRLANLFRRSFPQAAVYGTRWSKPNEPNREIWDKKIHASVDESISGFEVGKFYRNADADFPGTPYLVPCPDRLAAWRGLWAGKGKPVIGIAWSGGVWNTGSRHRKFGVEDFQPLFDAVDAHWVSLQYRDARKEIEGTPVTQYPWATLTQDYDDTAALVASCDLVIGVHTSVMHLAGALGVPAWILVPKYSQWRYGQGYEDLTWYKSARLYREKDRWPWKRLVEDLKEKFK